MKSILIRLSNGQEHCLELTGDSIYTYKDDFNNKLCDLWANDLLTKTQWEFYLDLFERNIERATKSGETVFEMIEGE